MAISTLQRHRWGSWCLANHGLTTAIAYDEEDDGFAFTRTRSKKAKAEPVLPSAAEEDRRGEQPEPVPARKSRKKPAVQPSAEPAQSEGRAGKRRNTRHSGEHENANSPMLQVKKRRKDRASSEMKADDGAERRQNARSRVNQDSQQDHTHPVEYTFDVTKIALPFADTPIIRRNKEMRKTNGSRRSSLANRGRRASSLIDTGKSNGIGLLWVELVLRAMTDYKTALPHDEVESSEFYKHIESEGLSEPRRMKQLLTWCGTRAMGERPSFTSEDSNARLAGRTTDYV